MKYLFFLLLICSTFSYQRGLDQLLIPNLKVTKAPLQQVLQKIIKYSKYQPIIDPKIQGTSSIQLHQVSFKQALQTISKLHNLSISFMGKAIVILPKEKNKIQKEKPKVKSFNQYLKSHQSKKGSFQNKQRNTSKYKFPQRMVSPIKKDPSLSLKEEQDLQNIVNEFSIKATKDKEILLALQEPKLLGITSFGKDVTAILRYKGQSLLCHVGTILESNVTVKAIFDKHLVIFDANQNKDIFVSF
ncbi:MAG: hypothetical protein COB02_11295 [Candidatus Cloacimonadota bacterium]|nr:MAG: hypothetical protein COB02_11295 [Candidatus Cloacimonadota bacterium]